MHLKQVIIWFLLIAPLGVNAQIPILFSITQPLNPGKNLVHIETSSIFYHNPSATSYTRFGAGIGSEHYVLSRTKDFLSFAPTLVYNGAGEESKTYSVENGNTYYYRSTTLTGRLLIGTGLYYKRRIGNKLIAGIGFQYQLLIAQIKDQYIYGQSNSSIPDIQFRKSESSILTSLTYSVDSHHVVNVVGQFGVSPITQGLNQPYANGVRLQIARILSF